MGLFGKHTKSGELGSMAQSLAKFAGGAVFAKDPQSSYSPSGGLVEGGEGAEGAEQGLTMMDRLGSGWRAMTDLGAKEQTSALSEKALAEAQKINLENEAKHKPYQLEQVYSKIDPSGKFGEKMDQFLMMSGANKDGGVMTIAENEEAQSIPQFNQTIADYLEELAIQPLIPIIQTNTRKIEDILKREGFVAQNGVMNIDILEQPDVAAQVPKAAEIYATLKNQKTRLKDNRELAENYLKLQRAISPPTKKSQEAYATESSIAQLMRQYGEKMTRERATGIVFDHAPYALEVAWMKTLGGYKMPMTVKEVEDTPEAYFQAVGTNLSEDDFLTGEQVRELFKNMAIKTRARPQVPYEGGGNTDPGLREDIQKELQSKA